MKVLIDRRLESGVRMGRKVVECELIEDRKTTILVRLPDGSIIKRKKGRDIPEEGE